MGFALPKGSSLVPRESSTTITSAHRQPAIPAQREYHPIDAALAITQTVCMVLPAKNEARNLPIVFPSRAVAAATTSTWAAACATGSSGTW